MNPVDDESLEEIKGGNTTISGPIISAITGIINVLKDAGHSLGSGIRRIVDNNLCPLE